MHILPLLSSSLLKLEFERKLDSLLLQEDGIYGSFNPTALKKAHLVLASDHSGGCLPGTTLRVADGKVGFFSSRGVSGVSQVSVVADLCGGLCPPV